jgi:hypothetical protein
LKFCKTKLQISKHFLLNSPNKYYLLKEELQAIAECGRTTNKKMPAVWGLFWVAFLVWGLMRLQVAARKG